MEIPETEPNKISSGTTVVFEKSFDDYLYVDGYTVAGYTISGSLGSKSFSAGYSSSTKQWTFTLKASNNNLAAGTYILVGYVQKGSGDDIETYEVYRASLEISASLVTAATTDTRSTAKKILDQLNTAITEYTVKPVEAITLTTGNGSRTLQRPSLLVLQKLQSKYVSIVNKEIELTNRANGKSPKRILGRFGCGV